MRLAGPACFLSNQGPASDMGIAAQKEVALFLRAASL